MPFCEDEDAPIFDIYFAIRNAAMINEPCFVRGDVAVYHRGIARPK